MLNVSAARLYSSARSLAFYSSRRQRPEYGVGTRMPSAFVSSRRVLGRRSRASIVWALGFLVGAQIGFFFPLSFWWPQLHDPQYGGRLTRLRARLAEKPKDQPFVLVLGSSHTALGVRPGIRGDSSPFLFNFSMNDGCPVVSLLCLHRLLAEGIKPDWLVVETCPLQLWLDGPRAQAHSCLQLVLVQHRDLPVLSRYYLNPHKFRHDWRKGQLFPWYFHRDYLLNCFNPRWLPAVKRQNKTWDHIDDWGWQWVEGATQNYQETGMDLEYLRNCMTGMFRQWTICDVDKRAIQEIIDICRREKIRLALLRMPEASVFLSWYPSAMLDQVDKYLTDLSREHQVAIVDARTWVPDAGFWDGHHLTPFGASVFTQRFDREFLQSIEKPEVTSQKSEVRGQRSEIRSQKSEDAPDDFRPLTSDF
jgi:hypothetical protein